MILEEANLKVRSSGISSNSFGIAMNRKMFDILSSGLYSDKVKAVIRELCTNAADAHVAAGKKDQPFEVHLPNTFEPWFAVTDYGTGLSPEQMLNIYTQYGVSNKTDSNDQTGCLGLGSKSPFAYTDSFTIESRYNGKVYTYTAYLNENGIPSLSDALTVTDTTESNGLKVQFGVKATDFNEFADKARLLYWFRVRPKVTGNTQFKYPTTDYLIDTPEYSIGKRSGDVSSRCVMGNVAYPIDAYQLFGYADTNLKTLLHHGIILRVNIGDVDITASRESLSYDKSGAGKKTIATLTAKLQAAFVDFEKKLTEKIGTAKTLWEATKLLQDIEYSFPYKLKGEWKGQAVSTTVHLPVNTEYYYYRYGHKCTSRQASTLSQIRDEMLFVLEDCKNVRGIVREYLTSNTNYNVYILKDNDETKQWIAKYGVTVTKLSTMPKPVRATGVRSSAEKSVIYKFVRQSGTASNCWEAMEVDNEDDSEYVYVIINRFKAYTGDNKPVEASTIAHIKELINTLTGKTVEVYGIRQADEYKLQKLDSEWTPLMDYVKEVVESLEPNYANGVKLYNQYQACGYDSISSRFSDKFAAKLSATSPLAEYLNHYKQLQAARNNKKVVNFINLRDYVSTTTNKEKDYVAENQGKLLNRYLLLNYVSKPYSDIEKYENELAKYVNAIDQTTN